MTLVMKVFIILGAINNQNQEYCGDLKYNLLCLNLFKLKKTLLILMFQR